MVLTNQNIDSKTATEGQVFSADVAKNVADSSGRVVIPKGSPAELIIRKVSAGNVAGGSELSLDLQSVRVDSHRYIVSLEDIQQQGAQGIGANKRTATMVGGGGAWNPYRSRSRWRKGRSSRRAGGSCSRNGCRSPDQGQSCFRFQPRANYVSSSIRSCAWTRRTDCCQKGMCPRSWNANSFSNVVDAEDAEFLVPSGTTAHRFRQ